MTLIRTIAPSDATGRLAEIYARVKGPDGRVDNILVAHSLRPASLEGHMALYKNVLHHTGNAAPKWFLETIGVYVSLLNGCAYCVDHHFEGLKRLLRDDPVADEIRAALDALCAGREAKASKLGSKERAALGYALKLTKTPDKIIAADIERLRAAGWDDGEILEINQVAAYFAYANRTVLGLGVAIEGDILGLSPSGDDWGHR